MLIETYQKLIYSKDMSINILTFEPSTIIAGDTVEWRILPANSEFYASNGYILKYSLQSQSGGISLSSTADGDYHKITTAAAVTALWIPTLYSWQSYFTKGTGESLKRYSDKTGYLTIYSNYEGVATGSLSSVIDSRSEAKKIVDACDLTLKNAVTNDAQTLQLQGRMVIKESREAILKIRDYYYGIYQAEQNALRVKQGKKSRNVIRTRFV